MKLEELPEWINKIKLVLDSMISGKIQTSLTLSGDPNTFIRGNTCIILDKVCTDVNNNIEISDMLGNLIRFNNASTDLTIQDFRKSDSTPITVEIIDYNDGDDLDGLIFQYSLVMEDELAVWATLVSYFRWYYKNSKLTAFILYTDELDTMLELAELGI